MAIENAINKSHGLSDVVEGGSVGGWSQVFKYKDLKCKASEEPYPYIDRPQHGALHS